ncbi:biotin--[acetyl-CoA-carboxylase] ligase [Undibacter mobilis]|uniref:biotin--[biotin carboxyl-carrier protein] ligase n=1 Tax=Undibacter mobilis TaxID=2292256 RepID=A0A371B111_9BRAD|nr:biotin--[acetyl-CoA-carboxylase] ligase [Undibacter mobilis]RDV01265.1 biotin--[acetyl-CoA-carboxylase] ligase [Undibacter mobilis]
MNREATDLAGVRHIAFDSLGSTNAEALVRARTGERGPLWITAAQQEIGRGRRGKEWASPVGNLYSSLLLTDPAPQAIAAQLSFVAALALHDAVADRAPHLGPLLTVKWPNDVLLGGAKIAGILIEAESGPPFAAVIGMGVNCASHPADTPYPATDLRTAGANVMPEMLLRALAAAMQARLAQWDRGQGFAAIRSAWLKRAAGLGQDIRVRLPEREFSGVFDGLDEQGRLLVRSEDGTTAVTAGEVFGFGQA